MSQNKTVHLQSGKYTKLQKVAEGTYGVVYKARNNQTQEIVSIKKFKNTANQGLPISFVREINIFSLINSQRALRLVQTMVTSEQALMVTEWMDYDLATVIHNKRFEYDAKFVMGQILLGLKEIHGQYIIHRDIKPSNIMIKCLKQEQVVALQKGHVQNLAASSPIVLDQITVKLIDYGMSKELSFDNAPQTNQVGSIFFRAPELFLGSTKYGSQIDMWSIGCIFYQLITKKCLFKGENELHQLNCILQVTGSAQIKQNKSVGISLNLPAKLKIKQCKQNWGAIQNQLSPQQYSLLRGLLNLEGQKRLACQQALDHKYFI